MPTLLGDISKRKQLRDIPEHICTMRRFQKKGEEVHGVKVTLIGHVTRTLP